MRKTAGTGEEITADTMVGTNRSANGVRDMLLIVRTRVTTPSIVRGFTAIRDMSAIGALRGIREPTIRNTIPTAPIHDTERIGVTNGAEP